MGKGVSLKQASFAGGVISPQVLGRTDQQKYAAGARTLLNAWVTRFGTIENRAGTGYCGSVKDPTTTVRTIPFNSFLGTSYLLEFGYTGGAGYIRPWKNGARISAPNTAWNNATAYAVGDVVQSGGDAYWCLIANTGHTPILGSTYWYLMAFNLIEIPTTIPAAAIAAMQFVQQNDVLTLASQAMLPQQLLHYSDTHWVFQPFALSAGIATPGTITVVPAAPAFALSPPTAPHAAGGATLTGADTYAIVCYDNTSYGSPTATFTAGANQQATAGSPITITWTPPGAGSPVGYAIYKQTAGGSAFAVIGFAIFGVNTFVDLGEAPAAPYGLKPTGGGGGSFNTWQYAVTAVRSDGTESLASTGSAVGAAPTAAAPFSLSWGNISGAVKYRLYRYTAGVPGYIGDAPDSDPLHGGAGTTTFSDGAIIPDTSRQPPVALPMFVTSSDYPAVVAYYQQRLCFANTLNQPSTVWMSKVGVYTSFLVGTPVLDSDAISFTIAGRQVQPIQALVDLGKLIVHTSNAEYQVTGNAAGVITPASVGVVNTGSAGATLIAPVVIGNTDLFVQQGATRLNDLRYEVQRFTFAGKDLTKYATDLFRGRTIAAMDWQKLPHSIVWCVLDNGTMVGLTYVGEDELYAWHQHASTNGAFEQVAVVIEGTQHVLYAVVRRTINGATARSIERFASRDCIDTTLFTDSVFLDASLIFDGRNTNPALTATLSTAGGWTTSDTLTVTIPSGPFVAGDVGNAVVFQQLDATTGLVSDQVTVKILGYTSASVVTGRAQRSVPAWAQGIALATWGKAARNFSGMSHLDGQAIGVLADGSVVADPLDASYPTLSVVSGAFALADPALVVCAGLPIQTDVQTLPLENATGETISNRRVTVRECNPTLYASRGGCFGQDSAHLFPWQGPPTPTTGYPVPGTTGPVRVPIAGTPQRTGQVFIRHTEPTPFALSAIVLTIELGD